MPPEKKYIYYFATIDYISALQAWLVFFIARKFIIEHELISTTIFFDTNLLYGLIIIPFIWIVFYYCSNNYYKIFERNRSLEILKTLFQSVVGCFAIFFILMLDDNINNYKDYYLLYFIYFLLHFFTTLIFRILYIKQLIFKRKIQFNALVIGSTNECNALIQSESSISNLYLFNKFELSDNTIPISEINIKNYNSIYFAASLNKLENSNILIINSLIHNIDIFVLPEDINFLTGKFKTDNVFGSEMISINNQYLKPYQILSKRIMDIILSFLSFPFLLIIFPFISILIYRDSKGKIFYTQKRIGKNGKTFNIFKFRTMLENAEQGIPKLTANNDTRITKIGKFLRKYRIDELPQLINVFIGDMSLVGPRPERQFYINQITEQMPQYKLLQNIKPGITSLGMVRFGYANSIEAMIKRAKYDLIYLYNISFLLDLKIIIYTFNTVLKGKGK